MDDAPSFHNVNSLKEVIGLFLNEKKTELPSSPRPKTVIKYTKLPQFVPINKDCQQNNISREPKLRRLVSIDNSTTHSPRSMKSNVVISQQSMVHKIPDRKMVTISKNEENDLHPKFSNTNKPGVVKTTSRSAEANIQREPKTLYKHAKFSKDSKSGTRSSLITPTEKLKHSPKPIRRPSMKHIAENIASKHVVNMKSKNVLEKDVIDVRRKQEPTKSSFSRNSIASTYDKNEKNIYDLKRNLKLSPKIKENSAVNQKCKINSRDLFSKKCTTPVIIVPLEKNKNIPFSEKSCETPSVASKGVSTELTETKDHNVNVCTNPPPEKNDMYTNTESQIFLQCFQSTDVQTEVVKTFESLNIPSVSLTKDKSELKDDSSLHSVSMPNLQIPSIRMKNKDESDYTENNCQNASYVISRATLTYTTKQKINLEVVGSKDNVYSNHKASPLSYPLNVVTALKKQMQNNDTIKSNMNMDLNKDKSVKQLKNCINELKSLDCSYVSNSNKLMKPSDVISTIRVNNDLLQSGHFCEQFQRELNFIDSFFESLQYLENCSFAETYFSNEQIDNLIQLPPALNTEIDLKITDFNSLLTKLENGESASDTETMASKNLFLLNRLIRNEQKRAKSLLFVLKRREDALKDFIKSQILYLENKKKQDNTDTSALKKKQRGALLKLQHECGEMQRMRKALLTLSEKRKVALLKTKKDLELRSKASVDVEQILLGKKKVKRNASLDRTAPLKCFDLSSSGCEDSTTSRCTPEAVVKSTEKLSKTTSSSSEKCIQTGDSILSNTVLSICEDSVDENFVVVDGGYLNILFHNLSLPQIFSNGKQYEVNQEALKNIINTTNKQKSIHVFDSVARFIDQLQNIDLDKSSTPSTARSLVEEFDQYYKSLREEEKLFNEHNKGIIMYEISDSNTQTSKSSLGTTHSDYMKMGTQTDFNFDEIPEVSNLTEAKKEMESPTGPLPIPAGASDVSDPQPNEISLVFSTSGTTSCTTIESETSICPNDFVTSLSSLNAPAQSEAEELRRQQLAIEKEIKELEQQQSRLLVVREIPDKPPPPYTPPVETKSEIIQKKFNKDNIDEKKIHFYIHENKSVNDFNDVFDLFVHDFCNETVDRHKHVESDKPWDSSNLLPPKPPVDKQKLAEKTSEDLGEVLSGVTSNVLFGVSSRRSDHIDDILFAEWRRLETEWTSLHADETLVKNQLFESIFQKILTETVEEYKRTVGFSEN